MAADLCPADLSPAGRFVVGIAPPFSGPWATPQHQVRAAQLAERLGFGSLWTFTRLLYPLDTGDPAWDGPFHTSFREVSEPLITLAYLAAYTSRIRLGISVINAPFFAPAVLAKQLIALDRVSGGRLDAGLAQGWSEHEFRAAGVPMARRLARMLEYVEVLRLLWENEICEFQGEFTELPRCLSRPRPVQPDLPMLLGGSGEKAWRRAGRMAGGWVSPAFVTAQEVAEAARQVRLGALEAGRDPSQARIVVRAAVFLGPVEAAERPLFHGSPDQVRADLASMAELGATEVFADLNFDHRLIGPGTDPDVSFGVLEEALEAIAPDRGALAALAR